MTNLFDISKMNRPGFEKNSWFEPHLRDGLDGFITVGLSHWRQDVADGSEQSAAAEPVPVHPFEDGLLDILQVAPR